MGGPPLAGADASCRGSCGDGDDADNRRREAMLAEAEAPMARVEAMLLMRGGRWTRLRLRRVAVDQAMAENPAWRGMVMAGGGAKAQSAGRCPRRPPEAAWKRERAGAGSPPEFQRRQCFHRRTRCATTGWMACCAPAGPPNAAPTVRRGGLATTLGSAEP
jgi:hypothetical protein